MTDELPPPQRGAFLQQPARERLVVGAVVLLAILLRVIYVMGMQANPIHHLPTMDSLYHVEWAQAFAAGEEYEKMAGRPFFRAPLYIWMLGSVLKISGGSLLAVRLFQCLLGGATALLVYLVGKRAFDTRVGLLAALLAATYWVLIYFDAELLITTLIIPLDLLAILLSLKLADEPSPKRAAFAGGAWGLSAIARPNVLLFMPLIALWLLLRRKPGADGGGLSWVPALAFSAGLLAPILPLSAHNAFVQDDMVLISSQAGVNFYIGNNPQADGTTAIVPGTRGGWWQGYEDSISLAESEAGRPLKASEVSAHYSAKAWDFILGEPAAALALLGRKLRLFWNAWEIGNNQEIRFFAHRFGSFVPWLSVGFPVLVGAGLLGFLLAAGRRREHWPLWGFMPVYMLSVAAFFVCSRFRAPVLPILMIYGAYAFFWTLDRVRKGERGSALAPWAIAIALGLFSFVKPSYVRGDDSNGWFQLGTAEGTRQNNDLAIEHFERALAINENNLYALINMAKLERGQVGQNSAAIEHLKKALTLDPTKTDSIEFLLDTLFNEKRYQELISIADQYISRYPLPSATYYHKGRALSEMKRGPQALSSFEEAQRRNPNSFRAALASGNTAGILTRYTLAAKHFERATQLLAYSEGEWGDVAFRNLIKTYNFLKDRVGAARTAARWLEANPGSAEARSAVQRNRP